MKRILSALSLFALAVIIFAQVAFAQCSGGYSKGRQADILCGPQCLKTVCQKFGIEAGVYEMVKLCKTDPENGTSMSALCDAAKAKGLQAEGMKISLDELAVFSGVAIAHLWNNHFVVVEAKGKNKFEITDYPRKPLLVPGEDFKKSYSGFALLVARDAGSFPKSESHGPDIRFVEFVHDFGFTNEGSPVIYDVKYRNVGNEELIISEVKPSCGSCMVLSFDKNVPPGGEGEIKAIMDTVKRQGAVGIGVAVSSNDPVTPIVQLALAGGVRSHTVTAAPGKIDFGRVWKGDSAVRGIYIPDSSYIDSPNYSDVMLDITKVSADTPYVTASTTHKSGKGYTVALTLTPGAPVGELKGTATIETTHPEQPKVEIPFAAVIKGDVSAFPDQLFFSILKKGSEGKSAIVISTISTEPLKIDKIDNPLDYISLELTPKTEGKEYILAATLKGTAPAGNIKSEIVIHTNNADQPEIKVPVYALVEE